VKTVPGYGIQAIPPATPGGNVARPGASQAEPDWPQRVHSVHYWRHRIELPGGLVTPGSRDRRFFNALQLGSLRGKSVLDIGAWDGLFSFEAERNGAQSVLATDVWADAPEDPEWWKNIREGPAGFLLARAALRSSVKYKNVSVYDLSPSVVGTFDVVLFLGVLYHLKDPFMALRNVASVTREVAVVETHAVRSLTRAPILRFYPEEELGSNPSNWWGPNLECLRRMLVCSGFAKMRVLPNRSSYEIPGLPVGTVRTPSEKVLYFPPGEAGEATVIRQGTRVLVLDEVAWNGSRWSRVEVVKEGGRIQGYLPRDSLRRIGAGTAETLLKLRKGLTSLSSYRLTVLAYK
jgi:tRNA (mo5U34)-methyltransferase